MIVRGKKENLKLSFLALGTTNSKAWPPWVLLSLFGFRWAATEKSVRLWESLNMKDSLAVFLLVVRVCQLSSCSISVTNLRSGFLFFRGGGRAKKKGKPDTITCVCQRECQRCHQIRVSQSQFTGSRFVGGNQQRREAGTKCANICANCLLFPDQSEKSPDSGLFTDDSTSNCIRRSFFR